MHAMREPEPGLLVCSLLSARMDQAAPAFVAALAERFGPLAHQSGDLPFECTTYYDDELGTPIVRRLLAFENMVPLDCLPEAKHFCVGLERAHLEEGRRVLNLDPGLITPERFLLATSKNFTHRVYLGQGVWADLTMIWTGGDWLVLPWTYRDYAAPGTRLELTALRTICLDKLRNFRQPMGMHDNKEGQSCC